MKPMFMMMVGLPYSGKSCYAEKLKEEFNAVVHSSDAIREEILGDVQDQNNNGNPHHDLTVGAHCIATYANIHNGSPELYEAAVLHDIGKAFTKAFKNSRGEDTDIAHYYEHHHVSAYDSLFYTQPALDVLYVAGVIQWHMRPFELERVPHAEKSVAKFKRLIGDKMYADVMALHEADIKAKMAPAEETK